MALLEVKNLNISFQTKKGNLQVVNDLSYVLEKQQTLGIVGESGSGKSVSAMSILQLLNKNAVIGGGEIWFEGQNLLKCSKKEIGQLRGNRISMIFQEPMTSLNPVFTIQKQLLEPLMIHRKLSKAEGKKQVLSLLAEVGIANPEVMAKQYPHQLSGGMRQRIMIAMALACQPGLLIADEPTTALDVTIQVQILHLMKQLMAEKETAILFISHDLGLIREMADVIAVMYCGQIVEMAPKAMFFGKHGCCHPYSEGLMHAVPRLSVTKGHRLEVIPGSVPRPEELPQGCKFSPRCKYSREICKQREPELMEWEPAHFVRCFLCRNMI